jgi:hypothetical protein
MATTSNRDAYGDHLETELSYVYEPAEEMLRMTNELVKDFPSNEFYGTRDYMEDAPGFIPDITDFTKILCFGASGDASPFCFDYREDATNPAVIWWDDWYWRKISPDFESFVNLFRIPDKDAT